MANLDVDQPRRRRRVRDVLCIFGVAFGLNWVWEAMHAAAYVESTGTFWFRLQHCLPMAGPDALWTLALWGTVMGVWWRADRHAPRLATLAALGAATAIVVERVALADGQWTYNALMPIVPVVDVGLWPVAQMTVLPVISVWLAGASRQR